MAVAEHVHTDECEHPAPRGEHPAPARWRGLPAWTPPVLVGVLGLAACVIVAVRDPNVSGSYGYCPSRALFGIDCPGCGLMRGTHALVTGDVGTALDNNVLILPVLGVLLYAYLRWAGTYVGVTLPQLRPRNWMIWTAAAVVGVFWIVRNLGGPFEYLASTAG